MPNRKKNNGGNNNNNRPYRLRNRYGNGRSRPFRFINYPMNTKVTTFGPGKYKLRVTKLFTGRLDVQQEINVYNDILGTNPELGRVINDFKYMLCEGIAVTFPARNLPVEGNMTPAYLMFNLNGTTTENIRLQDNVKMIPPFLSSDKIFKYKMPSINVYGGLLNKWFSLDNIAYAFANLIFQLYAPNNTSNWYIRFDVIITFRGPTNVSAKQIEAFKMRDNALEDEQANKPMLDVLSEVKEKIIDKKVEESIDDKVEINTCKVVSQGGFKLVPSSN